MTLRLYIFLVPAVIASLLFGSCKERAIDDDMPDSVKLELLDINLERHPDDPELLNNVAWLLATTPASPADPADVLQL